MLLVLSSARIRFYDPFGFGGCQKRTFVRAPAAYWFYASHRDQGVTKYGESDQKDWFVFAGFFLDMGANCYTGRVVYRSVIK